MLNKGILIFACGHPMYGRLAYNLCVTIKSMEEFPVAVVCDNRAISHLSTPQRMLFDQIIEVPDSVPLSCGSKLWAYNLTPFRETLLLDADMVWLPRKMPTELFLEMGDIEFTSITEGFWSENEQDKNPLYFFWADPKEIAQVYKTENRIYQWRSEVVYFRKTTKVSRFFKLAQKVWQKPGLETVQKFGEVYADELGFNVAAAVLNIHPHRYKWKVSYWDRLNGMRMPQFEELYNSYYLASFGAKDTTGEAKRFYDRILKAACFKLGIQHVFPITSKSNYLPERRKM